MGDSVRAFFSSSVPHLSCLHSVVGSDQNPGFDDRTERIITQSLKFSARAA